MPNPSLFRSRETGEIPFHIFRKNICKSLLQQDFGVDVSQIVDEDLEHTLLWYQADYELFLARIDMSDDSDTINLATALLDKKTPRLTGGVHGIKLLQEMLKKLDGQIQANAIIERLKIRLLCTAIEINNKQIIIDIIEENNPTSLTVLYKRSDHEEESPLHLAAKLGNLFAIKKILDKLSTPEYKKSACQEKNRRAETPLRLAVQSKNLEAVKEILDVFSTEAEKINACKEKNFEKETILHLSAKSGNLEIFEKILGFFATDEEKKLACLDQSRMGLDPLKITILSGNLKIFERIWDTLLTVEERKTMAGTLLFYAVMCGNSEIFEKIWALMTKDEKKLFCQKPINDELMTPMHAAVINGNILIIDSILAVLTDTEKKEAWQKQDDEGRIALHYAVGSNNPIPLEKIFSVFSTDDEKREICQKEDNAHRTPLHFAAMTKNLEIFEKMLGTNFTNEEKIAACKKEDMRGSMSVDFAIHASNPVAILKVIMELSTTIIDEPMGRAIKNTPLASAAELGKAETVDYLLKFLPETFSLADAEVLLELSYGSGNFSTQKIVTNKVIRILENQSLDNQQQYLNVSGNTLLTACKDCGNTIGFNTVAEWLQRPAPAATR